MVDEMVTADVQLRVYVVAPGTSGLVSDEIETTLCQFCWPEREAFWSRLGIFFDHVADANPRIEDCDACRCD